MSSLLDLLHRDGVSPRKVAGTHGGEYHSACPVCGGKDRFHCWPDRAVGGNCPVRGMWGCRACNESGDTIQYLRHVRGMSYAEACKHLGVTLRQGEYRPALLPKSRRSATADPAPRQPGLPPALWMEKNGELVRKANTRLLRTPSALEWLAGRGISAEAVERYQLGWLIGEKSKKGEGWYTRPLSAWGLPQDGKSKVFRFPRGLVIPRFAMVDGQRQVVALRIRRTDADRKEFAPETKYLAFKGSAVSPLVILPETPLDRSALVIVESELDAMLLAEVARNAELASGSIALVSNTAKPDAPTHQACQSAAQLLLCLDFDPADSKGRPYTDKALEFWRKTYPRTKDWPVPVGKDPGEAHALGADLAVWLELGLPPVCAAAKAGGAKPPRAGVAIEGGAAEGKDATEATSPIPADVHRLHDLMRRYPLKLEVCSYPARFAFLTPQTWRQKNWDVYGSITDLVMRSTEISQWLDSHPVQDGVINQHNLLKR